MPDDKQTIQAAYQDHLKGMFDTFVSTTITENLEEAAKRFTKGLTILRMARERALQIVAQA